MSALLLIISLFGGADLDARARAAFERGDHEEALAIYGKLAVLLEAEHRAADAAVAHANVARCLEELARFRAALSEYQVALSGSLPAALRGPTEQRARDLERTRLRVRCAPPFERVRIRAATQSCGAEWKLGPGDYEVAALGGPEPAYARVHLAAGEQRIVDLGAVREVAPRPNHGLTIGLMAGSGAALVTGLTLNLVARAKVDEADRLEAELQLDPSRARELTPEIDDLDASARGLVVGTYVAYGVALALGAAAGWRLLRKEAAVSLAPGGLGLRF